MSWSSFKSYLNSLERQINIILVSFIKSFILIGFVFTYFMMNFRMIVMNRVALFTEPILRNKLILFEEEILVVTLWTIFIIHKLFKPNLLFLLLYKFSHLIFCFYFFQGWYFWCHCIFCMYLNIFIFII